MTSTGSEMRVLVAGSALLVCIAAACSSSPTTLACTPGRSTQCAGPNGCVGFQVCNADGTFDPCECDVDGAPLDSGNPTPDATDETTPEASADVADVAVDAPADVSEASTIDAGPFSPSTLSGLVVWLDDTKGMIADPTTAGHIKVWQDQSGNGNDARANSPTPILDPYVVHQHDAISCDGGSSMYIVDSTSLQFGTGDYGIAIVARVQQGNVYSSPILLGKGFNSGGFGLQFWTSWMNFTSGNGYVSASTASTIGKFAKVIARATSLNLRIGGYGSTGPTSTGNVSVPNVDVVLCANGGTGTQAIELAEVIVVKGTLSDGDVANLEAYFKTKFNL